MLSSIANKLLLKPFRHIVAKASSLVVQLHFGKMPMPSHSFTLARDYHGSLHVSAKKGKGNKSKDSDDDNDAAPVVLPDMKNFDGQMEKKIARLVDEFAKLRNGQANTEIFKSVMVDAHGSRLSVADAGQLSLKGPSKMSISVFDPTLVTSVANAIRDCGMSLNPVIEGNNVVVAIPKPSKETRDALSKTASKIAEKAKQDIRQLRKESIDLLKKLKGSISDDDIKRYTKDVEALMEKKIEKIVKILKDKEKDILS